MPLTNDQRDAVTRLEDSLCVVAGAGTGKTRVLVERYLRLLSHGGVEPEHIAAITFTEKAAAGMASRLRAECDRRSRAAAPGDQRRLWRHRRDALAASTIDTIHGFCSRLIRQYPVEAGVDPYFGIITGAEQQQLLTDCVRATVCRLFGEGGDDIRAVARSYSLRTLIEILERAVSMRAAVMQAADAMERPTGEIVAAIREAVDMEVGACMDAMLAALERQAGLVQASAGREGDRAESARRQAAEALQMMAAQHPTEERLQGLRILASVTLRGGSLKNWSSKEFLAEVKAAVTALRDEARRLLSECPVTAADDWPGEVAMARSLARVAMAAIDDYGRGKLERGVLDFDDLLLRARDLLRDHAPVRRALSARVRHVLVDELQDTDGLQMEILGLLLNDRRSSAFRPRPGAFFAVGDPKQSIYRFRGADVAVFRWVSDGFMPDGVTDLSETFRFHAGLARVTNTVFAELLGADFAPLEARRTDSPPTSLEILLVQDVEGLDAEGLRRREAARVAHRIRALIDDEGVAPGDIAVLMHRQTRSFPYEDALTRLDVPFHVVGGRRFYEQEELRDAVTALRAVRNPGDDLSLAALLRGPLFGVSDDGLCLLCRAGRLSEAIHSRTAHRALGKDDQEKIHRATAWLAHFRHLAGRIGVGRLVYEVAFAGPGPAGSQGGLAHALLLEFLGEHRYANLRRLAEKARRADLAGSGQLATFLDAMQRSMGEGVEESEAPLSEEGKDAVLMMTVHKAKGLEFPYVFLANADAGRRGTGAVLYTDDRLGLAVRRPNRRRNAGDAAVYSLLKARDHRDELDEFKRLFYVAATRAQDRLFVTGSQRINRHSWLDWLGPAIGVDLCREPAGARTIEPAPGANVLIDVAEVDALSMRSRRPAGPIADVFREGLVDRDALSKLARRRSAGRLARLMTRRAAPIDADTSALRLSATALVDYARCPALFRFRHVLGLRSPATETAEGRTPLPDAATVGTIVHDCLRMMDFASRRVDPRLVERLADQHAGSAPAEARPGLVARATELLEGFFELPLAAQLAAARKVYREVEFLVEVNRATITGKIDLLFQDAGGAWTLVDYKTDNIEPGEAAKCTSRYVAQMFVYSLAAEKFLETKPENACLAFLRPRIMAYMKNGADRSAVRCLLDGIRRQGFQPRADCTMPCEYRDLCLRTP